MRVHECVRLDGLDGCSQCTILRKHEIDFNWKLYKTECGVWTADHTLLLDKLLIRAPHRAHHRGHGW